MAQRAYPRSPSIVPRFESNDRHFGVTLRRCVLLTLLPQQLVFSDRRGKPSVFYRSNDESQSCFLGSASHYLRIMVHVPDSSTLLVENTRPGGSSVWKKNKTKQ